MTWTHVEGTFNGVTEKKVLNNGTALTTFNVTEEARGSQEASTYPITVFKELATTVGNIPIGTPVVVKCKIDSRAYTDKNGASRRSVELKGFAVYSGQTPVGGPKVETMPFVPF